MYSCSFQDVSVSTNVDFFDLVDAGDTNVRIHAVHVTQGTLMGESAVALRIGVIRGKTTSGSGGASATPVPLDPKGPASEVLVVTNNTTLASGGAAVDMLQGHYNSARGFHYIWTPETRPVTDVRTGILNVRLLDAPPSALNFSGTVYWDEG